MNEENDPSARTMILFAVAMGMLPFLVISAGAISAHPWTAWMTGFSALVMLGSLVAGYRSYKQDRLN